MASDDDTTPKRRLAQVSAHVKPKDWSDITNHMTTIATLVNTPPTTSPGYIRQKTRGKLWVRERIHQLLDPGSFREIGVLTGDVEWKDDEVAGFTPSNNVQGSGTIEKRRVLVTADDYSIRAGHADGAMKDKTTYIEEMALEMGVPMIKLVDGSSGGGSVTLTKLMGYTNLPALFSLFDPVVHQLDAGIPNIAALLGPVVGLGAARATICHFSVMAADVGYLFAAGPKIVEGATFEEGLSLSDLGGAHLHCSNGTIDNLATSESECFHQIRRFLSYVPSNGSRQLPPFIPSSDPATRKSPELNTLIPRRAARSFDIRTVINTVVDIHSFFEIGALWGTTAVVGLARIAGFPVGIIASNGMVNAGTLDPTGCQKIARHLRLCDVFNIPVLQLIDCPGFAVGTAAEKAATMRWGIELTKTYYTTTTPVFSVIVRRCYGVAGGVMCDSRPVKRRLAWPSAEWGSLPLEGGVEVAHKAELDAAGEKRAEVLERLRGEYEKLGSPVRSANRFNVEEMCVPEETRGRVAEWVEEVYGGVLVARLEERRAGRVRVSFR